MLLPVTLTLAAACGAINLWLALRITRGRIRDKVLTGDGDQPMMLSRMRAHANFTEYAPIVLILTGLVELARGPSPWLWALGAAFVAGRIVHPFGMDKGTANPLRAAGAVLTWAVTALLVGWALAIVWQGQALSPVRAVPIESAPPRA